MYHILVDGVLRYYFCEKLGNKFVLDVYIIIGNSLAVLEYLDNSIYAFFKDLDGIVDFMTILDKEFSNLRYYFIVETEEDVTMVTDFVKNNSNDAEVYSLEKYLSKEAGIYDVDDNLYLKNITKEQEKISDFGKESYANYNGYNERLIDANVKNIVKIRRDSDGE